MTGPSAIDETVIWKAYPSWGQFTWLYFISLMAALRGLLFLMFDLAGWETWLGGAVALVGCAAFLRRWAQYIITLRRVVVRNGYTGHEMQAVAFDRMGEVTVKQGLIARFLGIGTIVIRNSRGERVLRLRGISDPEPIMRRIKVLRTAGTPYPPIASVEVP